MMSNRQRFTLLYEATYLSVLRYGTRRTDPATARDLAADVFLVAWRRFDDLPVGESDALMWLYGIARQLLLNARRSKQRRFRLIEKLQQTKGKTTANSSPDHADYVISNSYFHTLLARLAPDDREALQLAAWEGLDAKAAALVVGCSHSAMTGRLHRARKRLRFLLESMPDNDLIQLPKPIEILKESSR